MSKEKGEITFQDSAAIDEVASGIIGPEVHPRKAVIDGIADRLAQGSDPMTSMRVWLYMSDLASVVEESAEDRDHQEMIEDLRHRDGYQSLNTVMNIPDATSTALMDEFRQKLAEAQLQNPQA